MGLEAPAILAGSSGAIASLSKNSKMNRYQKFITVLSGGAAANYLTPIVESWLNSEPKIMYGVSFLIGYGGLKSVELIINKFFNKI
jgi:hypothetical protein